MDLQALIDSLDVSERIRDSVASILLAEVDNQKALAAAANLDPTPWDLRVFLERSDPWAEFESDPDAAPIVNVTLSSIEWGPGRTIEQQPGEATIHLDVLAGAASRETDEGHDPGDEAASLALHRAVRLVRQIIMASTHTYLGLRGTVGSRQISSVTFFAADGKNAPVQRVAAARLVLSVSYVDTSPQISGVAAEGVTAKFVRSETGQIYAVASWGTPPSP